MIYDQCVGRRILEFHTNNEVINERWNQLRVWDFHVGVACEHKEPIDWKSYEISS